ncbi:MAG: hypothetical protein ACLTYN_04830 [Dysosmobacter welbionis]
MRPTWPCCDIIASASNVGYNKFIMLVAHGADSSFIPAVHKLGMEGYFVLASTWYDFLRDNKNVLEDSCGTPTRRDLHGAVLYGDLVHMDLAIDGGGTPGGPQVEDGSRRGPLTAGSSTALRAPCAAGEGRPGLRRHRQPHQGHQGEGRQAGGGRCGGLQ